MVWQLLTGVVVGLLIGLALAPVLRAWLEFQQARKSDDDALRREVH